MATWPDLARPGLSPKLYDSQPCALDTNTSLSHHQHFPPTRHSAEHRRPGTGLGSKDTGETRYSQIPLSLWKLNQNTWRAQGLWGPGEALAHIVTTESSSVIHTVSVFFLTHSMSVGLRPEPPRISKWQSGQELLLAERVGSPWTWCPGVGSETPTGTRCLPSECPKVATDQSLTLMTHGLKSWVISPRPPPPQPHSARKTESCTQCSLFGMFLPHSLPHLANSYS